jgi:hypothetical protein
MNYNELFIKTIKNYLQFNQFRLIFQITLVNKLFLLIILTFMTRYYLNRINFI